MCMSPALQSVVAQHPPARRGDGSNTQFIIRGKVMDASGLSPLEYATVSAMQQEAIISGDLTDERGLFSIKLPQGRYTIVVEYLGYGKKEISDIELSKKQVVLDLGEILLSADVEHIEEIEVIAEKSAIRFSLDKKIYNVGKDLTTRSGAADDVLDNIPSISVDLEGNVRLRGSRQVRILIDGRPAGVQGVRGVSLLKSIQASQIDRVEVITNPSARYEAEGTAGIINIILKKNKKSGLNGSFDGNIGTPLETGLGISLNYRKNKINWFTRLGIRKAVFDGNGLIDQRFTDGRLPIRSIQTREHSRGGLSTNLRFGMDYHFDDRSILTTYFDGDLQRQDNTVQIRFEDFDRLDQQSDLSIRNEIEQEDQSKIEYLLSFKHQFESTKHYYKIDFQYQSNTKDQQSDFEEQAYQDPNTPIRQKSIQRSQNDQGENIYIIKADYNYPISKEGKIEFGYRGSIRDIRNDFRVDSLNRSTELFESIERFTNELLYNEDIHALYASIGDQLNKFSYLAGLRFEHSGISTDLVRTNEKNPRTYTNFFPSLFLSYKISQNNSFQLSYSKRIRRPRFFQLNPFFTFSNNRSIFRGNPNLDPQYTDSYEFSYLSRLSFGSLSSSLYYRHTTDYSQRILRVNADRTTVRQPENIGTYDAYGLEITYNATLTDWWKMNGNFNFFWFDLEGTFRNQLFRRNDFSYLTRMSSKFKIAKSYDTQISLRYRGPSETAQGIRKAILSIDAGASKDLLQNKATLTLSIRDVFNSRRWKSQSRGENFVINSEFFWAPRRISLSFNYRLHQKKARGKRGSRESRPEGGTFGG